MKYFYLFSFLFFLSLLAKAQDEIYLKTNEKRAGQVVDIGSDKIKYVTGGDRLGGARTKLKTTDVVLVFNSYGDYLVFNNGAMFSKSEGDHFLHETGIIRNNDLIFNNKGEIFTARILREKNDTISVARNGNEISIPTNTLVAVVRKNGSHTLFVDANRAIQYLTTDKKSDIGELLKKPEEIAVIKVAPIVKDVAPHLDTAFFKNKATQKVRDFEGYIKNIIDVKTPIAQSDKSIDLAGELFVPNSQIEISSLYSEVKRRTTIRHYLVTLQQTSTHYSAVKVQFASINYATEFTPNPDGTWSAVVSIVQKYEATADGRVVYSDVTTKNISVIVKKYKKTEENGYSEAWDVFLGDISVLETAKS